MDPKEFADAVKDAGDLESLSEAREATEAVFETFGERIAEGEAEDVASFVPQEFRGWLLTHDPESAADFGVDEFYERVADRGDVSKQRAREWSEAVFDGLARYAPARELGRVQVQLPTEYETISNWPSWTNVEEDAEHEPRSDERQTDFGGNYEEKQDWD
ncbi:MAG: DUF2267 domain-containing protein [Haloferacaceae archaeon]